MTQPDAALRARFEDAVARSKQLSERPDNLTLLKLYALFKQAEEGDASEDSKPGAMDFVGMAKWNARAALKGVAKDAAMSQYIELVSSLEG
jgi:diazepam-binding inhibitor (GABA receptor modulating acyl-CoA-binding protein)